MQEVELAEITPEKEASKGKVVPAVRRATAILWCLAETSEPMTLSQIARAADMLPSTALHILRELQGARLIAMDRSQKRYQLGTGLIELSQSVLRQHNFAESARPFLQSIAMRFNVTATATAAIDANHNACVAVASPPNSMSLNVTVGGRVPTLAGAAGRCIAAYGTQTSSELRRRFERVRWQADFTFDEWCRDVEKVRQNGFAEDAGQFALGVTTLAAPVFAADGLVRQAIGVATISATLDLGARDEISRALVISAAELSEVMRS